MKLLNFNQTEFSIAHFQGSSIYDNQVAINIMMDKKLALPDNLEIITFATNGLLDYAVLLKQLNKNGVTFINHAPGSGIWSNTIKPSLTLKSLKEVKSDYVLVLDSRDVLINGDITDIINKFESYNKDILFGATKNNHPKVTVDKVSNRDWRAEFKYLNAGTCMGRREALKAFYAEVAGLKIENPYNSEQYLIRHVFDKCQDTVDFDSECNIFQTFGKTVVRQLDDETAMVV